MTSGAVKRSKAMRDQQSAFVVKAARDTDVVDLELLLEAKGGVRRCPPCSVMRICA
jgi:hypothetical protein